MITTILFDLDMTLLAMDEKQFETEYFKRLAALLANYGVDPKITGKAVWDSVKAIYHSDGTKTNEDTFWQRFEELVNIKKDDVLADLNQFYETEFAKLEPFVNKVKYAPEVIALLKAKGYRLFLATNPLFPKRATQHRIQWAGLSEDDFEYVTTYETCHYCKPNPKYFIEIMEKYNLDPTTCLMVGNDLVEDTASIKAGIQCHIITDELLGDEAALNQVNHSDFETFYQMVQAFPTVK